MVRALPSKGISISFCPMDVLVMYPQGRHKTSIWHLRLSWECLIPLTKHLTRRKMKRVKGDFNLKLNLPPLLKRNEKDKENRTIESSIPWGPRLMHGSGQHACMRCSSYARGESIIFNKGMSQARGGATPHPTIFITKERYLRPSLQS